MRWWERLRGRSGAGRTAATDGGAGSARAHLIAFAQSRRGVEAYVEPATNTHAPTVVFVANDGEWTRRVVPSREAAFEFARSINVPVYDVHQTGYPKRMREWSSRQRRG